MPLGLATLSLLTCQMFWEAAPQAFLGLLGSLGMSLHHPWHCCVTLGMSQIQGVLQDLGVTCHLLTLQEAPIHPFL